MSNDFNVFDNWTPEQAAADAEAARKLADSKYWRWEPGINRLRIVPPIKGSNVPPLVMVWRHWANIPGLESAARFNCPRAMQQTECPFCTRLTAMAASSNPLAQKQASEWAPSVRAFANCVPRNASIGTPRWTDKELVTCKLVEFPQGLYKWITLKVADPTNGMGVSYSHHQLGIDFIVDVVEKPKRKYSPSTDPRGPTPLAPNATALRAIADSMHDLRKQLYVPPPEEIEDILAGIDPRDRAQRRAALASTFGSTETAAAMLSAPKVVATVNAPVQDDDL